MKLFKRILVGIFGLIVILLIIALFLKKDYMVERQVVINRPAALVFDYLKHLKNQNNFSKWARLDPNMKTSFRGTDATVGFVSAWEGNKDVGKGEQEIKAINEGSSMNTEIRFIKPFESTAQATMTTTAMAESKTLVNWAFRGNMPYPMNLMRIFGMEKMIGQDLQVGLDNLKKLLEK